MIGPWHVVLRDVMVFLAAMALFVSSVFMTLVGWQLWRLARELYGDSEPIVASIRRLVDSLGDTVGYVSERMIAPSADAVGGIRSARGLSPMRRQLERFYGGALRSSARKPKDGGGTSAAGGHG